MIVIEDLKAKVVKDKPDYVAEYEFKGDFEISDKALKQLLVYEVKPQKETKKVTVREKMLDKIKPEDITHDMIVEAKLKGDTYTYLTLKKKYDEYIKEHRKKLKKEMQRNRCAEYRKNNPEKHKQASKKHYYKKKKEMIENGKL